MFTDKCTLAPEAGPCNQGLLRWHFDSSSSRCKEFTYGGCHGNRNRFMTQALCESQCARTAVATVRPPVPTTPPQDDEKGDVINSKSITITAKTYQEEVSVVVPDLCTLPKETGRCFALIPSWYFDSVTRTCKAFDYGGCGGNANRFETQEACINRCRPASVDGLGKYTPFL